MMLACLHYVRERVYYVVMLLMHVVKSWTEIIRDNNMWLVSWSGGLLTEVLPTPVGLGRGEICPNSVNCMWSSVSDPQLY